ncbi:MAG: PBP1A family penicillin-binding protein [Cytophagales bacterium]|nr:PBP1A family penicillin-binding protein [Armatimonadota bacterium]
MAATSRPRSNGAAPRSVRRRGTGPTWGQRIRTFFGVVLMLLLLLTVTGIGYFAYLFNETAKRLPNPDNLIDYSPGGITEIFATDKDPKTGKYLLLGRVFAQNKEFIPVTQIPKALQNATVAIEDERFYDHSGIDPQGIARAIYKDITEKRMGQGGSTLTQQLARNVYLNQNKTFDRKLQEMLLAIQIEKNYSKEQILEMYLNEVCYGVNTFGVKAAAKVYFGKLPKDLTLAEVALLAGLPQQPARLEPFGHKKAAIERRNVILAKMAELGYIKPQQSKAAQKQGVNLVAQQSRLRTDFKAPYFTHYVIRQLTEKYGWETVSKRGLKVYTTLNWKMQQEAERALINGVMKNRDQGVTDGALVCIEPQTGYIRAMVGGMDFKKDQFNFATQGNGRQPGSSFKAVVYATALESRRWGPDSSINDSQRSYGGYSPGNHGRYHGWVPARSAFAYSYNAAAVWLANEVGINRVVDTGERLGLPREKMRPTLALALGAYPMTPLEMASAYSVFPNHGSRARPMVIRTVQDGEGVTLVENTPSIDQAVLSESTAAGVSSMMADVVDHGTAAGADGIHEVPNARGKTGTTNDSRDAWFIGYTPELTTAVWVCGIQRTTKKGRLVTRYRPMDNVYGGSACAPIWARFMKAAIPIQRSSGQPTQPLPEKTVAPVASEKRRYRRRLTRADNPGSYSNAGYRSPERSVRPAALPAATPRAEPTPVLQPVAVEEKPDPLPPASDSTAGDGAAEGGVSAPKTENNGFDTPPDAGNAGNQQRVAG